jgi:ribosomal protein S1
MEDFGKLLEESYKKRKSIESGSLHQAKIIKETKDFYFIQTLGEKINGVVSREEFAEEETILKPGDELDVYFLEESSGDYLFTHCLQGSDITASRLELSIMHDLPILGHVATNQQMGYDVKLGDFIAFCPNSQFEPRWKGEDLVGKKFRFVVTNMERKKIQVSQRKIADKEKQARVDILKSEWKVGSFVTVSVQSIQKSGLQVQVEGLSAFIPGSEASFKHNANLEKEFKLGQSLKAKIIELDWAVNRIILSAKDFLADPWALKLPFREGDILEGVIEKIKNFGIFIKLNDEFQGLVPNRELGLPPNSNPMNDYSPGQKVKVFVMEINPLKRQIALSIGRAKDTEARMEYQKYISDESEIQSTSSFGLLLQKSLAGKSKK